MKQFTISDFFAKKFEDESTALLLGKPSFFSSDLIIHYLQEILNYPISDFIQYADEHPIKEEIAAKDITQLSSIEDCTVNMCTIMKRNQNKCMVLTEIASELHADGSYKSNVGALTKYGENHVKTAAQLGLTICKDDVWFLTSNGYVFDTLPPIMQKKYIAVVLLRDPFYSRVIKSVCTQETTILKDFMSVLSESTQARRSSNCMKLMSFFIEQCSFEGIQVNNLKNK